ncbi:hypothetical protein DJ71_03140 [Halorubrum sp. E3]|nr:hypothetical protein DJ71_03140 [Halorubrum sp. E3]
MDVRPGDRSRSRRRLTVRRSDADEFSRFSAVDDGRSRGFETAMTERVRRRAENVRIDRCKVYSESS